MKYDGFGLPLQASWSMDHNRKKWLVELARASRSDRVLSPEENPAILPDEREQCVICDQRTKTWLMPENAPLCSPKCLDTYLQDPSVYDPRELHVRPSPRLVAEVQVADEPRRRKSGRWEPSPEYIAQAQARIRDRRKND